MTYTGNSPWRTWSGVLALYAGSFAIVMAGAAIGARVIAASADYPHPHQTIAEGMTAWDGEWFARVASAGYNYGDGRTPSLGFFPAYPVLGRVVMRATWMRANVALLITSNVLLLAALFVFMRYMSSRTERRDVAVFSLACLALFPTTFFFRMAYSDVMLLSLMVLSMYGMRQRWPPVVLALLVGLATATRAVGIALVAPFALHLWQSASAGGMSNKRFEISGLLVLPLSCWGLVAYMAYQDYAYGDPLAFTNAEADWHDRFPPGDPIKYAADLLTLEPVRAVYDRDCPCYWGRRAPHHMPLLNLQFANPIYFCGTAVLVAVGAYKGWLNRTEWVLSAGLLAIPYVSNAYRMCMTSHARFAAAVFPAYIVMGHLLAAIPRVLAIGLLVCSALLLGTYTALFTSWYYFL